MKALVLDGNAPAALAAVQSLGSHGVDVHVVAPAGADVFRSRFVKWSDVSPVSPSHPAYLPWLRSLVERGRYDLLVPATEHSLVALQAAPDGDELRTCAVLAERSSIETGLDKHLTHQAALDLGLSVPRSRMLQGPDDPGYDGPFPVVLKAVRSQVLRGGERRYAPACIARNAPQRGAFLHEWLPHTPVQEQQYVWGRGWGIECLYAHGSLKWSFAHERLHERPLTGGASTYRRSAPCPPALLEAATTLLDALAWHGVAMVEFRVRDDGSFTLLEINPRLWGSLPLAIRSGVDFPVGLLHVATGRDPGPQPRYRHGFRMRNLEGDMDWMYQNLRADRSDPLLLTESITRSAADWVRVLTPSEGWDHFRLSDPRPGMAILGRAAGRLARGLGNRIQSRLRRIEMRRTHARNRARFERSRDEVRTVMFACYGNVCRSPLAERLAITGLPDRSVSSTGLDTADGRETPAHVQEVAGVFGVDLSDHRSVRADRRHAAEADLILLMDPVNYESFKRRFPEHMNKILFLGLFRSDPDLTIPDPMYLDQEGTRASVDAVRESVDRFTSWLRGDA